MIYYTSDLHLGHENVIRLCDRPFVSVEEMDEFLIASWNKKVGKADTVYIVGDLVWQRCDPTPYLERLKGKKHLILGNHDKWVNTYDVAHFFEEITKFAEVSLDEHPMTLCHYPMIEWKNSRKEGSSRLGYLVHGHTHANVRPEYRVLFEKENALNAGVDVNGFAPVTFDEMAENNRSFKIKALALLGGDAFERGK